MMKYLLLFLLFLPSLDTFASTGTDDQETLYVGGSSRTSSYIPEDQENDSIFSDQKSTLLNVSEHHDYGQSLSKNLLAILRHAPTPSLSNPAFITSDFILRGSTFIHQDEYGKYWLKLAAYRRLENPGTGHPDNVTAHPVQAFFHKTPVDPSLDPSAAWSLITLNMLLTNEQILTVQAGLESVLPALHAPEAFLQPRKLHRSEGQPLTYDDSPVKYTDGCIAVRPCSPHTQERQK